MDDQRIYDCIIIGAGPGGLQAAIYLGRFNRKVLLIDRGGGRTTLAKNIENFLTRKAISGQEIIELGIEQAASFGAEIVRGVVSIVKRSRAVFEVTTEREMYRGLWSYLQAARRISRISRISINSSQRLL